MMRTVFITMTIVPKSRVIPRELGPVATPVPTPDLDGTRLSVLTALQAQPGGATVDALATLLAIHPNSVRNHIAALGEEGLVDLIDESPAGRGRPPRRYAASTAAEAMLAVMRAGSSGSGAEYRALAEAFARHLALQPGAVDQALAVGELWGSEVAVPRGRRVKEPAGSRRAAVSRQQQARSAVVNLLTDLGFAPVEASGDVAVGADAEVNKGKGQSKGRSKDADVVLLRSCPLLESARENQDVICSVHLGLVRGARRTLGASDADPSLEPFAQRGACRLHLPA